jgi:hypothetical protein
MVGTDLLPWSLRDATHGGVAISSYARRELVLLLLAASFSSLRWAATPGGARRIISLGAAWPLKPRLACPASQLPFGDVRSGTPPRKRYSAGGQAVPRPLALHALPRSGFCRIGDADAPHDHVGVGVDPCARRQDVPQTPTPGASCPRSPANHALQRTYVCQGTDTHTPWWARIFFPGHCEPPPVLSEARG